MKKLLLSVMLMGLTTITMAQEIDLDKSKGTDQEVISSLSPKPASLTVDENSSIEATFNVELQQKSISMKEVTLKKIKENNSGGLFSKFSIKRDKSIDGGISYSEDNKTIIFKPNQPLEIGYYEVEFKRLFSKLTPSIPMKFKHIKNITYRFYVPEVINGHMLPPPPDETVNNSTILGIDLNDNGVRDDVERKILQTYSEPIKVKVLLAYAKTHQEMLQDPVGLATESQKKISKVGNCDMYLYTKGIKTNYVEIIENLTYNTKKRVKAYLEFNKALSGGSYGSGPADWIAEACEFDVETMLKDIK